MEKQDIKKHFKKSIFLVYQILSSAVIILGILLAVLYLFGIRLYHVQSGSMGELLPVGSMCFVSTYSKFEDISPGDVISFRVGDDLRVTHRAIAVTNEGITTQGDMNEDPDPDPVTEQNYLGKTVFALPYAGKALGFVHTLKGKITVGISIVLLLLLGMYCKPDDS